jgi:methionyl-tRNA formyltransferase
MESGKVTLFVMSEKGHRVLLHAIDRYVQLISLVVVATDKGVENDFCDEIIQACQAREIPFIKREQLKQVTTEYALAVSWRWLISHPEDKLIVFHDSLLPKYRGFAPLATALIRGEREVGVTALWGAREYDRGPVIAQARMPVEYPLKIADAIRRIGDCYVELADFVLSRLAAKALLPQEPQDEPSASYSLWRDDDDYLIDWSRPAAEIIRFIDALGPPYRGAAARVGDETVRILDAVERPDVKIAIRQPGKVIFSDEGFPVVVCGEGLIKITRCLGSNGSSFLPLKQFRTRFA